MWTWASALSQIALTILGVVVSIEQDWAKRHRILVLVSFFMFGAVGVIATNQQASESARETTAANTALSTGLTNLQRSTEEITRLQGLNTQLQQKLLDSSSEINQLSKQNIETVTGGDSFCYAFIKASWPYFSVVHRGKYPLYDVNIRVVDVEKFETIRPPVSPTAPKLTDDEFQKALLGVTINIGTLFPNASIMARSSVFPSGAFPFSSSGQQDFDIYFSARNGFWTEKLRWRRIKDKWVYAMRVERDENKTIKILHQEIEKEFPRNSKGAVDWD